MQKGTKTDYFAFLEGAVRQIEERIFAFNIYMDMADSNAPAHEMQLQHCFTFPFGNFPSRTAASSRISRISAACERCFDFLWLLWFKRWHGRGRISGSGDVLRGDSASAGRPGSRGVPRPGRQLILR